MLYLFSCKDPEVGDFTMAVRADDHFTAADFLASHFVTEGSLPAHDDCFEGVLSLVPEGQEGVIEPLRLGRFSFYGNGQYKRGSHGQKSGY